MVKLQSSHAIMTTKSVLKACLQFWHITQCAKSWHVLNQLDVNIYSHILSKVTADLLLSSVVATIKLFLYLLLTYPY